MNGENKKSIGDNKQNDTNCEECKNNKEKQDFDEEVSTLRKKRIQPKIVYKFEEEELFKAEIEPNVFLRIVETSDGKEYIDIRRFYKGYPTKKGIRFNFKTYEKLSELLKNKEKYLDE